MAFGVEDKFSYAFFGAIEICVMAFVVLILGILWVWLPVKEPVPEEIIS